MHTVPHCTQWRAHLLTSQPSTTRADAAPAAATRKQAACSVACPGVSASFENAETMVRSVAEAFISGFVREFSAAGVKSVSLRAMTLRYRVDTLLFAGSPAARGSPSQRRQQQAVTGTCARGRAVPHSLPGARHAAEPPLRRRKVRDPGVTQPPTASEVASAGTWWTSAGGRDGSVMP